MGKIPTVRQLRQLVQLRKANKLAEEIRRERRQAIQRKMGYVEPPKGMTLDEEMAFYASLPSNSWSIPIRNPLDRIAQYEREA
jgi:hypothetical protein